MFDYLQTLGEKIENINKYAMMTKITNESTYIF